MGEPPSPFGSPGRTSLLLMFAEGLLRRTDEAFSGTLGELGFLSPPRNTNIGLAYTAPVAVDSCLEAENFRQHKNNPRDLNPNLAEPGESSGVWRRGSPGPAPAPPCGISHPGLCLQTPEPAGCQLYGQSPPCARAQGAGWGPAWRLCDLNPVCMGLDAQEAPGARERRGFDSRWSMCWTLMLGSVSRCRRVRPWRVTGSCAPERGWGGSTRDRCPGRCGPGSAHQPGAWMGQVCMSWGTGLGGGEGGVGSPRGRGRSPARKEPGTGWAQPGRAGGPLGLEPRSRG